MKRLSHLLAGVVALAWAAAPAVAQSPRFEIGGFGTYTRFDDAMSLDDRIGGGGLIAFHISRFIGLEVSGAYLGPSTLSGRSILGSGSLVLSTGGRSALYALGGVSRLDVGVTAPYNYHTEGFHGGVGLRIAGNWISLRAEGRALFFPTDNLTGSARHLLGSLGLSYFTRRGGRTKERAQPQPVQREPEQPRAQEPQVQEPQAQEPQAPQPFPPVAAAPEPPAPVAAAPARKPSPMRGPTGGVGAERFEFGMFGSFTRYDRSFELKNTYGGGIRLGYFLSDRINLELEGGYQLPVQKAPGIEDASFALGSVSLGYNFPIGGRNTWYLLGGFTRQQWGDFPPFEFSDNGVHGAIGTRLFLTDKMALRLEGRAIYAPKTNSGTAPWSGQMVGTAGLSFVASPPRQRVAGGVGGRAYQWYWGGQGGLFIYKTNTQPVYYDPLVGGHWMISKKVTSLYVAYEQAFFLTSANALIFDPSAETTGRVRQVDFSDMRRIMIGVLAHPAQKVIEPFGGMGFAMMQVLSPSPDCSADCETLSKAAEAVERAESAASKAFFWVMAGLQMNYSNKLNVFGHYVLTSSSRNFLLEGNSHTFQGGVRISFGPSKEGIGDRD